MKRLLTIALLLLTFFEAGSLSAALPEGKINLQVLYVGLPDTDRTKSFKSLLEEHFTKVAIADYNTFQESQTAGADVVILDKDGVEWKELNISLSDEYSKPTITIGTPGAFWCHHKNLKIRYM